jgi:hypothetical protein
LRDAASLPSFLEDAVRDPTESALSLPACLLVQETFRGRQIKAHSFQVEVPAPFVLRPSLIKVNRISDAVRHVHYVFRNSEHKLKN